MDTHAPNPNKSAGMPVAIGLSLGAFVVAGASWALLGYLIAWKLQLSLGMILPPFAAGCLGGLIMRLNRPCLREKTGWVAAIVVLVGTIVGDILWIMLAQQKSLSVLFGSELTATLNTLTNLFKLIMYAVASYLAFAIANPPRGVAQK